MKFVGNPATAKFAKNYVSRTFVYTVMDQLRSSTSATKLVDI